jgi:hypothetical protein
MADIFSSLIFHWLSSYLYAYACSLQYFFPNRFSSKRSDLKMNLNERSLTTTATLNAQGASGTSNHSDEQTEPAAALSIFSLDYKK